MTVPATSDQRAARAAYAADASRPGPRLFDEPAPRDRTAFQRDRDRLLHSVAFRRLAGKTQVLDPRAGAQHRTRLTHTLEVAQIARSLARALGLDEDLAEALALAHDFGHGPFGHTGEAALDKVLAPWGGFDHNVQSLRIVVDLERRYLDFDGLNLTWTTLEGLAKRKGPSDTPSELMRLYDARLQLRLDLYPGAEAQAAAVADDIAYNAHDLEDGLLAGFFGLDALADVPVAGPLARSLAARCGSATDDRIPFAMARGVVDLMITDAIAESRSRLGEAAPRSADDVRRAGRALVGLSPVMAEAEKAIKTFLFANMYRHARLMGLRQAAHDRVGRLAAMLLADPARLPAVWRPQVQPDDAASHARAVADYVAGLTDGEADAACSRLFDAPAEFL